MFVLKNFLNALAMIIDWGLTIYLWIIVIRALISWVNPDPYNPIVRFLYQATEPVLSRVRRWIPYMGGIDLSPLIVILAIIFIRIFVVDTIRDFAFTLR